MADGGRWELEVVGGPHHGRVIEVVGQLSLGSAPGNAVQVSQTGVQPSHAEFEVQPDDTLWLKDLSGTRETFVDGSSVTRAALPHGASVRLGSFALSVRRREPAVSRSRISQPVAAVTASGLHATAMRPSSAGQPQAPVPGDESFDPSAIEATVARSAMLRPGQVVAGRYEIVGKLAAGGMGEVYKAQHVELGKVFALKVMKQELSADRDFVDRFKREAIASSRIGQHNIVDISDFGRTEEGRFYFVMEYLEGSTLAQLIKAERTVSIERALRISIQIARALAAAHALGIVHRDLKPENVIVLQRPGSPDFVKVLDFGIAKVTDGRGEGGHTAIGIVVGTPQYMSPEQASAMPVDARSDIYSLALILYELITGRPVFDGATPSIIMAAHIAQPPPPMTVSIDLPAPPAELERLVLKMLAKKPPDRPQTMNEVALAFEQVLANHLSVQASLAPTAKLTNSQLGAHRSAPLPTAVEPPVPSPTGTSQVIAPRSKLPRVAGASFAVVALLGLGWWVARPTARPPTELVPPPPPVVEQRAVKPEPQDEPVVAAAAPATVKLQLTTRPAKAEVFEGEALIGKTPLALDWEEGKVAHLSFKLDGYLAEARTVAPRAPLDVEVTLRPVPKRPTGRKPVKPGDDLKDAPY